MFIWQFCTIFFDEKSWSQIKEWKSILKLCSSSAPLHHWCPVKHSLTWKLKQNHWSIMIDFQRDLSGLYFPSFPCFYSITWQELSSGPWAQACRTGAGWRRQTRGASSAPPPTSRPASFERQGCPSRTPKKPPEQRTLDPCERNNLRSPDSEAHVNFPELFPTCTLYSLTIKITFGYPSHPTYSTTVQHPSRWCLISTAERCS